MANQDISQQLQAQVKAASAAQQPLRLHGGNSKAFYGETVNAKPLNLSNHVGIVDYEPTELALTARCGATLHEINALLTEQNQILAFEPPCFNQQATLGGAVASGLSGPARPWRGAPRDSVLGIKLLDGRGDILSFGGQVMKNVAGYDVSRLMAGAQGTLGILLEVSVKVLPAPDIEMTLVLTMAREAAQQKVREIANQPAPLSGACHWQDQLYLRLSGNQASVDDWHRKIGGDASLEQNDFWQRLRDHQLSFFHSDHTLWRLSLPPAAPALACEQNALVDWAGAQRWVYSDHPAESIRREVGLHQGHAEAFRHAPDKAPIFHPAPPRIEALQKKLRRAFDPQGIFNPGRLG